MLNNITVVIPCYNARDTIIRVIDGVFAHLPKVKIIIVDDNSPDGSARLVKKKFFRSKKIALIIRKDKQGRGSAVLAGFKKGLEDKDAEFFVEMDADLCHDPKYIPALIEKCRRYDVAIASKYLSESRILELSKKRQIFSRFVNFYIKFMLKIPITDYTNGFRCYTRKALEKINFDSFHSKGFIVLSEIIYRMHKKGVSIGEIPFVFNFNHINKTNFNSTEISEAFFTVLKLKLSSIRP